MAAWLEAISACGVSSPSEQGARAAEQAGASSSVAEAPVSLEDYGELVGVLSEMVFSCCRS
jgi:hypothetical protein